MSTAIDLAGALHEAVLYSAPDELAERLVPRMLPSLDEGAPVVAVLDETTRAEVRRALGDAAERVEFPDPAVVHRVPPFTVASRWARLSRRVRTSTGRATVVGQHVEGLPGCDGNHWARLDLALNVAVVGLPITVLCPYRTDDPELARVEATHPRLVTATGMVSSGTYRPPSLRRMRRAATENTGYSHAANGFGGLRAARKRPLGDVCHGGGACTAAYGRCAKCASPAQVGGRAGGTAGGGAGASAADVRRHRPVLGRGDERRRG